MKYVNCTNGCLGGTARVQRLEFPHDTQPHDGFHTSKACCCVALLQPVNVRAAGPRYEERGIQEVRRRKDSSWITPASLRLESVWLMSENKTTLSVKRRTRVHEEKLKSHTEVGYPLSRKLLFL